jgi:hypothetical protein
MSGLMSLICGEGGVTGPIDTAYRLPPSHRDWAGLSNRRSKSVAGS